MIEQITPAQAEEAHGRGVRLIDVRNPWEYGIVHIEGAELLDHERLEALMALPKDTELMFLCHHGVRSMHAASHFASLGFTVLRNVAGGIDAWADHDPSLARY